VGSWVPGPRLVDAGVLLLHPAMRPVEEAPRRAQRPSELLPTALAEPPVEEELLLGDPEFDLRRDPGDPVDEGGAEELAQRHRIVVLRDRRYEALVEVDALELDSAPGEAIDRVARSALERLNVEHRDHRCQVRHGVLAREPPRPPPLAHEAPPLAPVCAAGRPEELAHELAGDPFGPPGTGGEGGALGVDPADRLV